MSIDLSLNETQTLIQNSAHDFFAEKCPPDVVRELEASERGYSPEMWQEMAAMGWLGITFPESHEGSGGTFLDMYPLYEEMGRALVPSPHLDTVAIAGEAILAAGSEAQKKELLPAIAQGKCIISFAIVEADGGFGPGSINMKAEKSGNGYVLNGTKLLVAFAPSADKILCVARTSGPSSNSVGADGISLFLVDAKTKGLSCERLENIAGGALFALTFDGVTVPESDLLGSANNGWGVISPIINKAAVLQSGTIVGSARPVLEFTTQYAKDRHQFGIPIGKNQFVQQMVTDILFDLHRAELLNKQAAFRIDAGKSFEREAGIANAFAKQAAAHLMRQAHETHAGIAFILDHDMNLYSRRAKFWENNLGDARYHLDQIANAMDL